MNAHDIFQSFLWTANSGRLLSGRSACAAWLATMCSLPALIAMILVAILLLTTQPVRMPFISVQPGC